MRDWVLALKHGGRLDLARPLAELLAMRVRQADVELDLDLDLAVVCSVPLHPARRFVRGYDQAGLLARFVALELGLICLRVLQRTRATPPQGAAGAVSRSANVRGAFRAREDALPWLLGRSVLLVDDVVTSGATADECARCLRRAGASSVIVVCLARAIPRRPE